ncbi:hypothetical protein I317_04332 [Kwoniella heveanensis CBS 569]|nr:hypothetical protein I317_04332 [Kwoniella heveanensis CBS 569]
MTDPTATSSLPVAAAKKHNMRLGIPRPSTAFSTAQLPGNNQLASRSGNGLIAPRQLPSATQDGSAAPGQASRRTTMITSRGIDGRESVMGVGRGDIRQGRPSLASGMHPSSIVRDPRPVRDKAFQNSCVKTIGEYLAAVRYPGSMTPKTLVSPTAKEFHDIFRFLVNDVINVGMVWGKKFDDDANTVLKDLRYPSMESFTKTSFTAPGSPQSWPNLLAMLNWLVELCKAHDNWNDSDCTSDPVLMSWEDLPLDYPNLEDRLLWNFACKTYDQWFNGAIEEFSEAEQELENIYGRMMTTSSKEREKLEMAVQKRDVELHQLQAQEPPLKKIEDEYVQLMSDKTKFIAFIDLHRQKAEKTRQAILKVRAGISGQVEEELESQRSDLARIESAVNAQNLSPDEVNKMNHDRDTLIRHLDELRIKIAEVSQSSYDQELMVTKCMDRFESLHADYTSFAHQIGLLSEPRDGSTVQPDDINYHLDFDLGGEGLEDLRTIGSRMRTSVWQGLQARRETYRQRALELSNDAITLDDIHDRIGQQVDRRKEEAANLEVKLRMTHEKAEAAQTKLGLDNVNTNEIIVQLETEVTNMLAASQQGVLTVQSQLESTRIAFKELRHRSALLKDAITVQVGEHIDMILKAKQHALNSLRSIRALADAQ